jgi:hypothetical protein
MGPFWADTGPSSSGRRLLHFLLSALSYVAFWHHHPRDQNRVSCRMNSDLFILALRNVFVIALCSSTPLRVNLACTRVQTELLDQPFELHTNPSFKLSFF